MKHLAKRTITLSILAAGVASAAVPVEKSGPCPPLTRHKADAADDWTGRNGGSSGGWAATPVPADSFPIGTIQDNLKAAQSINCMEPAAGMKVQLWASEEMDGNIKYLQHMTFDERGRVWAVEPASYPNIIRTASSTPSITDPKFVGGLDRIVILEDTDGDQVMDKLKVFKTGLNMPQSIEVVNGGVVVGMTPYIVFFPNVNDVAGTPVILFSGMGSLGNTDTHGGINQLMYGLDNWIYGITGYNGCKASPGDVYCGHGRTWRFHHTALGQGETKFQVWNVGPQNADGLGQMEDGQIFQNGATGTSHMNHAAVQKDDPNETPAQQYVLDIRTVNPAFNGTANPKNVYYPITGDRFLWEGQTTKNTNGWFTSSTTAVSGLQFYTSRVFPKKYWNRFAFTCEGSSKLCNQDSVAPSGSSWKAFRLPGPATANLLASRDAWVAPLLAKTGPDGAVWVLDWNNYLFLHNPAGPGGVGGAWINALRTKTSNRIYRILPTDGKLDPVLNLSTATEDQLLETFGNSNFHWRLAAQRLLIGKGVTTTLVAKLTDILKTNKELDEVGNSPRVQHALWTLDGLGVYAKDPTTWVPILKGLLKHPAWCVRRNVPRVMPTTAEGAAALNDACSVNDPHAHVRLQALLAFSKMTSKPASLNPIQASFASTDGTSSSAQQASGIPTGTPACTVTLDESVAFIALGSTTNARQVTTAPREGLRFHTMANGFQLLPHGNLPSGVLTVYDLKGRAAFTSRYNAGSASWSVASAQGLNQPVYAYDFRGADGYSQHGSIALLNAR